MGKGSEWTFFKGKCADGQQAHGKMLDIARRWENASENLGGMPRAPDSTAVLRKTRNDERRRGRGGKGSSRPAGVSLDAATMETGSSLFKTSRIELPQRA